MSLRTRVPIALLLGALTTLAFAWLPYVVDAFPMTLNFAKQRLQLAVSAGGVVNCAGRKTTDGSPPQWWIWRTRRALVLELELHHREVRPVFGYRARAYAANFITMAREMADFSGVDPVVGDNAGAIADGLLIDPDVIARGYHWEASGWPFLALWKDHIPGVPDPAWRTTHRGLLLASNPLPALPLGPVYAPLQPRWSGLLANIGIFALAWFVVLATAGAIHIAIRKRRGLCTHCAYDRRGIARELPCPECGHAKEGGARVAGTPVS